MNGFNQNRFGPDPALLKHKRTSSVREILKAFYSRSGKAKRLMPANLVLLFLDGLFQAAVPGFMGYIVDQLIRDPQGFVDHKLWPMAGALVCGSIMFYFIAYIQHYLTQKVSRTAGVSWQVELYAHLQNLSADFYQRTHVGEITSRLTKDISQGVEPMWGQCTMLFWSASVLIPSSISLGILSWQLLLIYVVIVALFAWLTRFVIPIVRKLNLEVQDEAGRISARITEDVSANALIRAFAQEETFFTAINEHTAIFLTKALRTAKISLSYSDLLNTFLSIASPLAMLLAGAWFVAHGNVTVGAVVAAYGYWKAASAPVSMILNNTTAIFASFASTDRILEFFREQPKVMDAPDAVDADVTAGDIVFDAVRFRYPVGEGEEVLRSLTLHATGKKSLAIVGESGAGKSTIVQLIMRFYDPLSGSLRVDGADLRTLKQASLRNNIGLVMQETILLSGSIRQNMLFAKPEATEPDIINALKQARAWDFINSMPQGLDTRMGERGARLSGGQKQRLAIARVFLKNPPIVVFDEATSALDTITEKLIQETMKTLLAGRTSVVIAHRLSTIIDCDQIVVLEKGTILAQGTHQELFDTCDHYREMCSKQMIGRLPGREGMGVVGDVAGALAA